ncbi:MetQ/NlpA family ABC transporter substrate-binding protein [Helcococcus sueciensis]|uniref:MetQ/NlpA family ABC transporter substrate-binding protein n=1 Tax=Helcococcus sueciensis TaxID=241555 RepID=UPI00041FC05A|nr:MetQ/NlpA family ABC transporter substrate-binding protein [Helcococcus sueciensis]
MKKILALLLAFTIFLVGCASTQKPSEETMTETNVETENNKETSLESDNGELEVIKVASHVSPMTDILKLLEDELKEKGYKLELLEVSDNVQANIALKNEEADANFFQHEPFMQMFNKGNDASLVRVTPVYNALVAFYSKDYDSIDALPEGAVISIPNDVTNRARALRLLATSGAITLSDPDSYDIEVSDIKENPKNFEFKEWDLLNLNEAYQESDLTFNYPTYIQALDLKPIVDGLLLEPEEDQVFAISLVAREDNKDSEKIKALKEAITSDIVKDFINTKLEGHAKPAF